MNLKQIVKPLIIALCIMFVLAPAFSMGTFAEPLEEQCVSEMEPPTNDTKTYYFDDGYTEWNCGTKSYQVIHRSAFSHLYSSVRASFWARVICHGTGQDTGRVYGNMWDHQDAYAQLDKIKGDYNLYYNFD